MGKKSGKNVADEVPEYSEPAAPSDDSAMAEDAEEIADLQQQLDQALDEKQKIQEQYLRALAEMDNLRKRTVREKEDISKFANESILREILPVIDNLERAVEHAEQVDGTDGLLEGVRMTLSQFSQVLKRFGVEVIDALGKPFDPDFHQAMGYLESPDVPVNTVMMQMQKGYQLNERLLRPAFVMLAKTPADTGSQPDDEQ